MEIEKNHKLETSCTIGPVEPNDMDALKQMEAVQAAAWEMPDREIVPSHVLEIVAETGGQLLAARTKDNNRVIGFILAFLAKNDGAEKHLGIPDGELFFASHQLAVLPDYQSGGIGRKLKDAQRLDALHRGIRWMQWTYYPMLTKNGSLNFRKLHARSYKFVPDKYGVQNAGLYEGLPSDRLIVLWDLKSREGGSPPQDDVPFPEDTVILTRRDDDGRVVLDKTALETAAAVSGPKAVICSVPRDFLKLRKDDLDRARVWQETFALVATTLFSSASGWAITNYRDSEDKEEGEYLFVRE
jgi:predicted GNAT superfamily acetyltransferase